MHTHTSKKPALLTVNNVSWQVGSTLILEHINLSIERGKFVGLIGPNGAGKSSLLRCLYRFNKPSEGVVKFNNTNIWQLKSEACRGSATRNSIAI